MARAFCCSRKRELCTELLIAERGVFGAERIIRALVNQNWPAEKDNVLWFFTLQFGDTANDQMVFLASQRAWWIM